MVVVLDSNNKYVAVFAGKRSNVGYAFQNCYWVGVVDKKLGVFITKCPMPMLGYKFATLHGQKGVVCKILPDYLMPRGVRDGCILDAIIHPVTILSRLTVGQLKNNRFALQKFRLGDGKLTLNELQMHRTAFFQQRNVPEDKFHYRNRINVYNTFTRQPTEG